MAVLNPPVAVQARTDTNADDLRAAITAGLAGTSSLKPRAGIAAGWGAELSVTQSGTPAMNVVVGSGQCLVAAPTAGHGGWWVINDGNLTVTITAANATNPRIDLIIARVADATYFTGGDGLAAIKVITGTAGASPAVPTVPVADGGPVATGSVLVLAQIAVAANATSITTGNITLNTASTRPMLGAVTSRSDNILKLPGPGAYPSAGGTASAGSATLPAAPVGFFYLDLGDGVTRKVPYYNS